MDFSNKQNLQNSLADQWRESSLTIGDVFKNQENMQKSKSIFECLKPYLKSDKDQILSPLQSNVAWHEKIEDLENQLLIQKKEISIMKDSHKIETLAQEKKFADLRESTNKKFSEYDALFITQAEEISKINTKYSSSFWKVFSIGYAACPTSLLGTYLIVTRVLNSLFP